MRVWRRPTLWVNSGLGVVAIAGALWAYQTVAVSPSSASSGRSGDLHATVGTGQVIATVSASGTVQSANTAGADFITAGTVTEIDVKVGDPVTKGQQLAKVDPAAAQETLDTARANLQAAKDALSRAESSSTSDAATISAANAQVSSAQATVDADQRAVNGTVLTAPIAGTVIAVDGSVGNPSGSGSSGTSSGGGSGAGAGGGGGTGTGSGIGGGTAGNAASSSSSSSGSGSSGFVQIADLTKMQVSASFAEADASKLKVGQAADITWSALSGARATGKVATISPTATSSGGVNSYAVTVSMDTVPDGARIGQTTSVQVTTAEADNVLRVPRAAVRSAGGLHTVQVVSGTGTSTVRIQVGVTGDSYDEVTSGLTQGQTVVLTPVTGTTGGTGAGRFGGGAAGGFGGAGGLGGAGGFGGGARGFRGGTGTGRAGG